MSTSPPLTHRERGRLGARKRWGPEPRTVSIDVLEPTTRAIVIALVELAEKYERLRAAADQAA